MRIHKTSSRLYSNTFSPQKHFYALLGIPLSQYCWCLRTKWKFSKLGTLSYSPLYPVPDWRIGGAQFLFSNLWIKISRALFLKSVLFTSPKKVWNTLYPIRHYFTSAPSWAQTQVFSLSHIFIFPAVFQEDLNKMNMSIYIPQSGLYKVAPAKYRKDLLDKKSLYRSLAYLIDFNGTNSITFSCKTWCLSPFRLL